MNKKKQLLKLFILPLALLLPAAMQGQRIHAYVTTGLSLSQIEGDALKGFHQAGNVSGVGALVALDKNYRWGLTVETLFAQRGALSRSIEPYRGGFKLNYVDIPVLLHYQDPYGGMLFGVGLAYGRLVQQPHGKLEFNANKYLPDTTDLSFLKNDLCVVADVRFTVWRSLQLNLRWQHSIIAIKRNWLFQEKVRSYWEGEPENFYNHSIALRLIYQF